MALALVTGTSSGIGLATSVSLARSGHTLIATMRDLSRATELKKIAEVEDLPISFEELDVNSDTAVDELMRRLLNDRGHIDVLVNNAGLGGGGSIEELPLEFFREVMETNYFGALRCIKALIPSMRTRRAGCIINVTSIAGRMAIAPAGSYAASKWALEALSESLAQEMKAFNVRVAIVEPGVIATPIFSKARPIAPDSPYPHARRQRALFSASLTQPTSPYIVGEKICEIVKSGSWQLRYPVGPDAEPFLKWRAGKTDEEIVQMGGATDEEFKSIAKREFGLDVIL
ncbi:SDR family oxidoreductase [Bradyrhizobium manausense]|uniref:SDR family oxidoreductase n=1 Tax=Bradyrhizobium manausense TaxID=989370 RepID=UPI001BAC5609|nr:SDR family oxidoreductase [Bradyrhizobium manausense]MBR1092048.1 SDR family oxidoreductase [Bradyrhizobium manausense]